MSQSSPFEEFLTLEQLAPGEYISKHPTEQSIFGPTDKIAFGGCTLALSIKAGYATIDDGKRLFSCVGSFLAPAFVGEKLSFKVSKMSDTRSISTRYLQVFQQQAGKAQHVASMHLNFQLPESDALVTYSPSTSRQYSPLDKSLTELDVRNKAAEKGLPKRLLAMLDHAISSRTYFELRAPPESFSTDTVHGFVPQLDSVQKHLSVTDKATSYYWRSQKPLKSHADNVASLAYLLDAGMGIVPIAFAGLDPSQISTVSSLDFAMRVFSSNIDAHDWLQREEKTIVAGEGRTYQEARFWDSTGKLIASMSSQCLLRGKRKAQSQQNKL